MPEGDLHGALMNLYGLSLVVFTATEIVAKLRPDTGLQFWFLKYRPTRHSFFTISATEIFLAFVTAFFAVEFYYEYVSFLEIGTT